AALHATVPDYDLVDKMQEQLVFLRFMFDVPEGRVIADYQKIIDMGCNGLIDICRAHLEELGMPETGEAYEKYTYYLGTIMALEGVIAFANNYADEALRLAEACDDEERANELREIARICRKVPAEPSDTFQEAVQAWWFAHLCIFIELNGRGISPGRFDQYMYRPYLASKQAGTLTDEEALELMELLRVKCTEIGRLHPVFTESYLGGSIYQNLTLGGSDRYGMPADNELSRIVLKAGINVKTWQPTLSVRWRDDMSKEFKDAVVECIKAGSGYPALFNDKMGTERFMKDSGANLEDARDWAPCGCVDMQLCGKRMPMYSVPHTNNLKILELVMNDGVNPVTGDKLVNVSTPFLESSFEQIVESYHQAVRDIVEDEERCFNIAMAVHNSLGLVHPFLSALLDDCLDN
ncbi:pyruvate formate lyase family protein, partial [Slackia piriformis]|nr:pyruvate formate lyase family protein [Slackia piriformis]